jgi:hypothetical protein
MSVLICLCVILLGGLLYAIKECRRLATEHRDLNRQWQSAKTVYLEQIERLRTRPVVEVAPPVTGSYLVPDHVGGGFYVRYKVYFN